MRAYAPLTVLLLFLVGCGDPPNIKIGFIGNLEGRASGIGVASLHAVQLAIDKTNAEGGINGKQIELIVLDDKGDSENGASAAQSLADEGVDAIFGPNLSVVAKGILPIINRERIVTVSSTVASLHFVGKDDYFYRIQPNTRQFADAYARYAVQAGYTRMAVSFDRRNAVFTDSWLAEFRKAFSALGGEVVVAVPFDATVGGAYAAVADDLLAPNPDAILHIANGIDTAGLSQQVRQRNDTTPMMAAAWAASEGLIELGGHAIQDLVLLQVYDRNDQTPRYAGFRERYLERFQSEPSFVSVLAYDGALVLFAALRQWDGASDLKPIMDNLEPVKGLQKPVIFDHYGDTTREMVVVSVKGGEFVRQ